MLSLRTSAHAGVAIPLLRGEMYRKAPGKAGIVTVFVVIVTWFHSTGGLPHQSADWFAMTENLKRVLQTPICRTAAFLFWFSVAFFAFSWYNFSYLLLEADYEYPDARLLCALCQPAYGDSAYRRVRPDPILVQSQHPPLHRVPLPAELSAGIRKRGGGEGHQPG